MTRDEIEEARMRYMRPHPGLDRFVREMKAALAEIEKRQLQEALEAQRRPHQAEYDLLALSCSTVLQERMVDLLLLRPGLTKTEIACHLEVLPNTVQVNLKNRALFRFEDAKKEGRQGKPARRYFVASQAPQAADSCT